MHRKFPVGNWKPRVLRLTGAEVDTGKAILFKIPTSFLVAELGRVDALVSYDWLAQNDFIVNGRRHGLCHTGHDTGSMMWFPGVRSPIRTGAVSRVKGRQPPSEGVTLHTPHLHCPSSSMVGSSPHGDPDTTSHDYNNPMDPGTLPSDLPSLSPVLPPLGMVDHHPILPQRKKERMPNNVHSRPVEDNLSAFFATSEPDPLPPREKNEPLEYVTPTKVDGSRPRMLDLFSGSGSVSDFFQEMGFDTVTVDYDPKYSPDILTDVLVWEYWKDFQPGDFDLIVCCPPCTEFSQAQTRRARNLQYADSLVQKGLEIIHFLQPEKWILENPQTGLLKSRSFMKGYQYVDLDYCCFSDWGYQKKNPNLGFASHWYFPPCIL